MIKIGLFPLGIVLFPESSIPLHIFEERYKVLMNDCESNSSEFGINLVNPNNLNEIGCMAKIEKIIKKYSDGKMDLIVSGTRRYRLINFSEGEKPYFTGEIEYYDDLEQDFDYQLFLDCTEIFNNIVSNITTVKIDKVIPHEVFSNMPSYIIAQKSGLTIKQRQSLLEMQSENARLNLLIEHLKNLLPVLKESELLTQIIKNDGYFPPKNFNV